MQGTIGVDTTLRANPAPATPPEGVVPAFLGTAPATRGSYQRAVILTALLLVAFGASAPFASRPLLPVPAFVPAYDAAIAILDLITAVLLYTQFRQAGERSFLALASGYLLTPLLILAHALSFPDAFRPGSLIGGEQTAAWLWMAWHTLFPLFVVVYALLVRSDRSLSEGAAPLRPPIAPLTIVATIALAGLVTLVTTKGESLLPPLMVGSRYESATRLVLLTGWLSHMLALALLIWSTRLRRVIDIWIAVTLVALLIDLTLSGMLVNGRYEVGFYLGRVYGLVAAVIVLAVLLRETVALYGHAVRAARAAALAQSLAQRDELRRQLRMAEEERRRLARELHDELGQHLTALGLGVQALADRAGSNTQIVEHAALLGDMVNALGRGLHSVAVRLRPKALDDFGLDAALSVYAEEWSRHTGIAVDLHTDYGPERLPMVVESAIYRVVQEALTNVARHSGATRAGVVVERRDGNVVAIIEDSGKGFDTGTAQPGTDVRGGLGLLGVRERATLLGGTIDIESTPGGGTTLFVRIPINGSPPSTLNA